jgi:putative NADH-flavin reductase
MTDSLHVLVLGESGGVGREVLSQGLARGLRLTAQTSNTSPMRSHLSLTDVVSLSFLTGGCYGPS